jgi:hypothetical protein
MSTALVCMTVGAVTDRAYKAEPCQSRRTVHSFNEIGTNQI